MKEDFVQVAMDLMQDDFRASELAVLLESNSLLTAERDALKAEVERLRDGIKGCAKYTPHDMTAIHLMDLLETSRKETEREEVERCK